MHNEIATAPAAVAETLEQYADRVAAATRKRFMDHLDDDVIGLIGNSHLIFGKACAMEAISTATREVAQRSADAAPAAAAAGDAPAGEAVPKKYWIVWNGDRTEGFITDEEQDARSVVTGRSNFVHGYASQSTAGAGFHEAYEDASDLSIEEVSL